MKITFIKYNIFVNIINMKIFLFNILEHKYVPKHRILSEKEIDEVCEQYNIINDSEWPEISRFDPVAKTIGIKPGQLCEIIRPSKTAITSKYYRLCL